MISAGAVAKFGRTLLIRKLQLRLQNIGPYY